MSEIDRQIEQLRNCKYLPENEVKDLCNKARELLIEESNIQRVDAPVTVKILRVNSDLWRYSWTIL